jgi:hypothetical protein
MFGRIVGVADIVKAPKSPHTLYPFGPLSDIAGKRLWVLERNEQGDCLCIVKAGAAIADVAADDVAKYTNTASFGYER